MKYLVTMEMMETVLPAITVSPQQTIQHLEQRVIPCYKAIMKLETEKKILVGGVLSGRMGHAFIVEAASNNELARLLQSLPLHGMMKVDVTPLHSFEDMVAQIHQIIERLKVVQ